jgi:hypothetical protein
VFYSQSSITDFYHHHHQQQALYLGSHLQLVKPAEREREKERERDWEGGRNKRDRRRRSGGEEEERRRRRRKRSMCVCVCVCVCVCLYYECVCVLCPHLTTSPQKIRTDCHFLQRKVPGEMLKTPVGIFQFVMYFDLVRFLSLPQ